MNTDLTLQQALDKFYAKNQKYFNDKEMSKAAKQFYKYHDVAHVIFDCDVSIYGEGIVKIWTIFGTDLSFRKMLRDYKEANAFEAFKMYSTHHVLKNIFRYLRKIPRTIIRARQMKKKWQWANYEPYLNKSIAEIRIEFNIQPI